AVTVGFAGCLLGGFGSLGLAPVSIDPLGLFGIYCLLIGYLISRSTFLPRVLGMLMGIGGLGWLTFLVPSLARGLTPFNMLPGVFGESALTVWLLAKGVDAERWRGMAGRSG